MSLLSRANPQRSLASLTIRRWIAYNELPSYKAVDVPGLSGKVLSVPKGEVGPGASKTSEYKNPEYFCYSTTSFHEAEVELRKYRLPQPSNKTQQN